MAVPVIRATVLLTTATAAAGTLLYENHEPFRTWADDVGGRAQAAWVGLKEEFRELKQDIEGHRRREAPFGANAGQWEGVPRAEGPWRRRRRHIRRGSGPERARDEHEKSAATGIEKDEGALRKRRGSVHEGQFDPEKVATEAADADAILNAQSASQHSELRSRASTETMRSAQEEALHEEALHEGAVLTPTTSSTETMEIDDGASMSVVSAPSEMGEGVLTPMSGLMTPTSSSADEVLDFEELRMQAEESEDGRSETAGREDMEDARSEVSGVSEWSRVSGDVVSS